MNSGGSGSISRENSPLMCNGASDLKGKAAMPDLTQLLNRDDGSPDETRDETLFAELYDELRRMAHGRMARERRGHTLDTCGLVHEAWLRLKGTRPEAWRDRGHFFAAATESMRRILVENARRRLASKRGGGEAAIPEEKVELFAPLPDERLLEVHEVLDRLEEENPTNAQIVKLRYFGGLKHGEIAAVLEMSETTVRRHWAVAKVWLCLALEDGEEKT